MTNKSKIYANTSPGKLIFLQKNLLFFHNLNSLILKDFLKQGSVGVSTTYEGD